MCGISGICNVTSGAPVNLERLISMTSCLRHRGPDQSGIYIDDAVGMGHRRLSIIDLGGGSQPIHNEDGSLWLVYNGEIFNYPDLREMLVKKGHTFYTSTDSEVLLHLYEEKGPAGLCELNGQFAFAIWDAKKRKLFLARDRVGVRPIFYTLYRGRLIFASEIKSIFMADDVPRRISHRALDQIFTFWTTLPGHTCFEGIHELPPGHYMTASNGLVTTTRYWDIPGHASALHTPRPVEELVTEVRELLVDATRIRLRADVPVGCYLSGGLDSSGITSLVTTRSTNRVRTFGIRFADKAFDERTYQDAMVSFLGTEHTAITVEDRHIAEQFADVLWHCEKPLLRTAPAPLFMLSRSVRDHGFKVVLTGEGADEVFGGYNIFRESKVRAFWARQPGSARRPLLLGRLYPYIFKNERSKAMLPAFFGAGIDDPDHPLFSHLVRWNSTARLKTLFSGDVKASLEGYSGVDELKHQLPAAFGTWDTLSRAQYLETLIFMSNYLLSSQGDRVAMAHSVEIRMPYLDHRVIEYMARVPSRYKIAGLKEKSLLKKVYEGIVPDAIRQRPKTPYRAPVRTSLLASLDTELHHAMLTPERITAAGLFDPRKVDALINKLRSTTLPNEFDDMALAGVLSTQHIHSSFLADFPSWKTTPGTPDIVIDGRTVPGFRYALPPAGPRLLTSHTERYALS